MNCLRCMNCNNRYRSMEKDDITMEELKKLQNQRAIILDVRSPQEYLEGHIEGAIVIPEYELKFRAQEILKDKTQTIIVYCPSGIRSKRAQRLLKCMGYKKVYNLYKGLENY